MFTRKRWIHLFALIVVGSVVLSACGPTTPQVVKETVVVEKPVVETVVVEKEKVVKETVVVEKVVTAMPEPEVSGPTGTIIISQGNDADNLDPLLHTSHSSLNVYQQMCQALVESDVWTGDPIPVLATDWELVDDYTWRFKIRPDVKFHNGEVMTTEDVAYNFNRILTEEKQRQPTCHKILKKDEETGLGGGATVIDDEWVEIRINQIFPAFLDACVQQIDIVSKKAVEEVGIDEHNQHPICAGPFKFAEWVKDDHLTMEAFEDYWGEPARIKTVIWRPIADSSTRIAALEAGDVDLIVNTPPLDADRFDADPNDGIYMANAFGRRSMYLGINTYLEPFHDVRVRQAVGHAIDKETLVNAVLNGHGRLEGSPLVRENLYSVHIDPWPYDLEKVKALLKEAGWEDTDGDGVAECHGCEGPEGYYKEGDDLVVDFDVPHGRYNMDREVGEAIAGMLGKAGFKVNLMVAEWGSFYQKFLAAGKDPDTGIPGGKTRDKSVNNLYWVGSGKMAAPDDYFNIMWHSTGRAMFYVNPDVDALIDAATGTYSEVERTKLFAELQELVFNSAVQIFIYQQHDLYGVRDRLKFTATPDERIWIHPYAGGEMAEIVK